MSSPCSENSCPETRAIVWPTREQSQVASRMNVLAGQGKQEVPESASAFRLLIYSAVFQVSSFKALPEVIRTVLVPHFVISKISVSTARCYRFDKWISSFIMSFVFSSPRFSGFFRWPRSPIGALFHFQQNVSTPWRLTRVLGAFMQAYGFAYLE